MKAAASCRNIWYIKEIIGWWFPQENPEEVWKPLCEVCKPPHLPSEVFGDLHHLPDTTFDDVDREDDGILNSGFVK